MRYVRHIVVPGWSCLEAAVTVTQIMDGEALALRWRGTADADNPAGPLYAAGEFAEADIVAGPDLPTHHGCSDCTASRGVDCC
jgi:hypothetical protein